MLGIYAALLHLRRETVDAGLLTEVFDNLTHLVGPHPDVLAMGWALCRRVPAFHARDGILERLTKAGGFEAPPTMLESWEHVVRATPDHPRLIVADSLADRIADRIVARGPWLTWRGDIHITPRTERRTEVEREERKGIFGLLGSLWDDIKEKTLEGGSRLLQKGLHEHPEWRERIQSPHFTRREKRLAYFVYPLLEPSLRRLVERTPVLRARLVEKIESRDVDEAELVKRLGIPVGTAVTTIARLYARLMWPSVAPSNEKLEEFVEEESQSHPVLRRILDALDDVPTEYGAKDSERRLSSLDLVYLRYRNSPRVPETAAPTAAQLAATLGGAGYVLHAAGRAVEARDLNRAMRAIRSRVRDALLDARASGAGIAFGDAWIKGVMPSTRSYSPGSLFPPLDS
jgi:hypothetical protein